MNKVITLIVFVIVIGITSCKKAKEDNNNLELAKQYYTILDNSNDAQIGTLLTDSLLTRESEYDYEQTFSLAAYKEWLRWDAVFEPTYKILQIEEENGAVKVKVSKEDKRILFLHEEPIITNQTLRFNDNKIISIETSEYVHFNDSLFVKNRDRFLNWIDKNHPELNGFIYDQTQKGAIKYLKAIEVYKNKE